MTEGYRCLVTFTYPTFRSIPHPLNGPQKRKQEGFSMVERDDSCMGRGAWLICNQWCHVLTGLLCGQISRDYALQGGHLSSVVSTRYGATGLHQLGCNAFHPTSCCPLFRFLCGASKSIRALLFQRRVDSQFHFRGITSSLSRPFCVNLSSYRSCLLSLYCRNGGPHNIIYPLSNHYLTLVLLEG